MVHVLELTGLECKLRDNQRSNHSNSVHAKSGSVEMERGFSLFPALDAPICLRASLGKLSSWDRSVSWSRSTRVPSGVSLRYHPRLLENATESDGHY